MRPMRAVSFDLNQRGLLCTRARADEGAGMALCRLCLASGTRLETCLRCFLYWPCLAMAPFIGNWSNPLRTARAAAFPGREADPPHPPQPRPLSQQPCSETAGWQAGWGWPLGSGFPCPSCRRPNTPASGYSPDNATALQAGDGCSATAHAVYPTRQGTWARPLN